jgi:DNA helicase IV
VRRSGLARLLFGSAEIRPSATGVGLCRNGTQQFLDVAQMLAPPRIESRRFWANLETDTPNGIVAFRGFPRGNLASTEVWCNESLRLYTEARLKPRFEALAAAFHQIELLLSEILYVRDSRRRTVLGQAEIAASIVQDPFWDDYAGDGERAAAETIQHFINQSKALVDKANERFIESALREYAALFDSVEKRPLTNAQRRACVIGEDHNLVLAGAGTGKTSTMVGRAGYLLASRQAAPEEILMLAYNKKAADEMQERQGERLSSLVGDGSPEVRTFHALGLKIIGVTEGRCPDVSPMVEDRHRLVAFITDELDRLRTDPEYKKKTVQYLGTERYPYRSPFDFASMTEYEEYVRRNEIRTLKGEAVKSFEECAIANLLTAHGIRYEYEKPYVVNTSGPDFRTYKPDFYLPDFDLYIEHFALNRDGQPPAFMDQERYLDGIAWKRATHWENWTMLLETYSFLKREGRLESFLAELLDYSGIELTRRSDDEMLDELRKSSVVAEFAGLLADFLEVFKQSGIPFSSLRATAQASADRDRLMLLLDLFEPVLVAYQRHLTENEQIDFADMIERAIEHVEAGRFRPPFSHILVDEFQDISRLRARLIQALLRQRADAVLFAVGDDWQSIYRFAGSDIGFVRDFSQIFGATATVALDTTFRFNDQIGKIASRFVLSNPMQVTKDIASLTQSEEPSVSMVPVRDESSGLALGLRGIEEHAGQLGIPEPTVLVMARYNFVFDKDSKSGSKIHEQLRRLKHEHSPLHVRLSTVHKAKGKEADFVVVLGLTEGKYGFPSEIPPSDVLEWLLPPCEDFPYAEERRLFYVALTRARHRAYVVYNPFTCSSFVAELLAHPEQYPVCIDEFGDNEVLRNIVRVPCPSCSTGILIPRNGEHRPFVGCSHYPYCSHSEQPCTECGSIMYREGRFRYCTKADCDAVEPICPECGGTMVLRTGRGARAFWGCSNYRRNVESPCRGREALDVVAVAGTRIRQPGVARATSLQGR